MGKSNWSDITFLFPLPAHGLVHVRTTLVPDPDTRNARRTRATDLDLWNVPDHVLALYYYNTRLSDPAKDLGDAAASEHCGVLSDASENSSNKFNVKNGSYKPSAVLLPTDWS